MDGQDSQPKSPSKIGQIEARIDGLLGLSARVIDLSVKISDRLLGSLPVPNAQPDKSETETPKPIGKLEAIRDRIDTIVLRLSATESTLIHIDKETE